MTEFVHVPIMLSQTMELLRPQLGGVFVDGTLGGGGHSEAILKAMAGNGRLYGIDRDADAIEAASKRLACFGQAFTAVKGNFFSMTELLAERGVTGADGILLDLGVSSYQLDSGERGFSYHEEAPLDMRMDRDAALSAYDVVNGYSQQELARVIRDYGEERFCGRIAATICRERDRAPIATTTQLAELIKTAIPAANRREGPHPARRTFQAIRIEVNGELEGLKKAIDGAKELLLPNGVLAVITFHSLEDRIVKQAFKEYENPCICDPRAPICTCGRRPTATILTKKPIIPGQDEEEMNPRSRSAKLRAIRKL